MLSELDELIGGNTKFCFGFSSLDIAVVKLLVGAVEGLGGITDLANSEADF